MTLNTFIARERFRFLRGYSWFVVAGIPYLTARSLTDDLSRIIPIDKFYLFISIMVTSIIIIYMTGLIDDKGGFLQAEQNYAWQRNPAWVKSQEVKV